MLDFDMKEDYQNIANNLVFNQNSSKSMYMLNRFEQWYSEGNRMPENQGVLYFDIEQPLPTFDSEEHRIKHMNFLWFMVKFGGYTNAQIYEKGDE